MAWAWVDPEGRTSSKFEARAHAVESALRHALQKKGQLGNLPDEAHIARLWRSMERAGWQVVPQ